jgi:S1-C subfamily serine protease
VSLRNRHRVGVLVLAIGLAFPMLASAGPAQAEPSRTRPAAAPASDLLGLLNGLLARLVPMPAPAIPGVAPGLVSQVTGSTVRVSGVACGVRLQGSGFSPAPETIVTNAHVVAGTTRSEVLRPDGRTLPATVTAFDPVRDLAVLSVPGLGEPSLGVGSAVVGETDGIFGHPFGQVPIEVSPARVLRRVTADIGDIYDRPASPRQILVLTSQIDPGDSGAPLVNSAGQVVGVAFAVSNLRPTTAFAVAAEEIAPVLARPRSAPVSTGRCLDL